MNLWGELPATAVIFAACDSVYFLEHAPALVYSADKIAKNVHLHVCNPTPEVYSLACVLTSTVNIAVTFSFNEVNFPADLNDSARQTYFACLRFLVLPEILPSAGRVLTVDVDCFFNADFDYPDASLGYFPREPLSSSDARIKAGSHVAAGVFWLSEENLPLAKKIRENIKTVPLNWFADQIALHQAVVDANQPLAHRFDAQFMDWNFRDGSVIWTGKGDRKTLDQRYVARKKSLEQKVWQHCQQDVVILKPRLDCPFKRSLWRRDQAFPFSDLRSYWSGAAAYLQNRHLNALVLEAPLWMFNNTIEPFFPAHTTFYVPHREAVSFQGGPKTNYYMQTVFPWLFTIDTQGWGGGGAFVTRFTQQTAFSSTAFDKLSDYIKTGQSKFPQPQQGWSVQAANITRPFIFVPLQLPHDETIFYHSDISMAAFVSALCSWVDGTDFDVEILFKGHPVNLEAMAPLVDIIATAKKARYVTDVSIHDLIPAAAAVYVLNSGVGQEAMLHEAPVVAFARSEYIGAVIKGEIDNLDGTFQKTLNDEPHSRVERYKCWYAWYLDEICHDVSAFTTLPGRV